MMAQRTQPVKHESVMHDTTREHSLNALKRLKMYMSE
jgi:hypothetical protein